MKLYGISYGCDDTLWCVRAENAQQAINDFVNAEVVSDDPDKCIESINNVYELVEVELRGILS